ncbi:hypothetical protein FWK35_00025032 [Aphis craccivora]|uniref:Uncharacterized protein n=1 Tax=Aphis craccivora TaxID=307492 RepID=A0A6G0YHZ7_APHCR|nr:hypothetical protein FWK35_00025032 [Aphis craccivora]
MNCRNKTSISKFGGISDGKVNILGALWRIKIKIFKQFSKKKNQEKQQKKSNGKMEFLLKTSF